MALRSKVAMLPQEVRGELEHRMAERAFGGYAELARWLQGQGYEIAEASVQRYGSNLQREVRARERAAQQAKAIAESAPEGRDAIVEATIHLIHCKIFEALVEVEQVEQGDIARVARTAAELSRATIARQRWAQSQREQVERDEQATILGDLSDEAHRTMPLALKPTTPSSSAACGNANTPLLPANDPDPAQPSKSDTRCTQQK